MARTDEAWMMVEQRVEQAKAETARTDWRPLCSYTANLERLGEALLNTDAAWVEIGRAVEATAGPLAQPFVGRGGAGRRSTIAASPTSSYRSIPWIWSAGVLAGLLGLSIWILSTRVKSLDRLK